MKIKLKIKEYSKNDFNYWLNKWVIVYKQNSKDSVGTQGYKIGDKFLVKKITESSYKFIGYWLINEKNKAISYNSCRLLSDREIKLYNLK